VARQLRDAPTTCTAPVVVDPARQHPVAVRNHRVRRARRGPSRLGAARHLRRVRRRLPDRRPVDRWWLPRGGAVTVRLPGLVPAAEGDRGRPGRRLRRAAWCARDRAGRGGRLLRRDRLGDAVRAPPPGSDDGAGAHVRPLPTEALQAAGDCAAPAVHRPRVLGAEALRARAVGSHLRHPQGVSRLARRAAGAGVGHGRPVPDQLPRAERSSTRWCRSPRSTTSRWSSSACLRS
jgi:hypothetical protein